MFLRSFVATFSVFCLLSSQAFAEPLIRDAEIEHTLRTYANPVFKVAGLKPSAVHLFIVQDDALNAYVAGGANMFIYTGMILACDTPNMVISIMAHETGHIVGGHLAQGAEQLKNAELGTILTFVLGAATAAATRNGGAAAAVITGGQSSVMRNFIAFTRTHEEQADQSALSSLDKLDISASGMLKVFELLRRHEREQYGTPDPYLQTHPLTSLRIEHVRNHVQESKIPEGQYPKSYDILHKRMVAKLYGFLKSPEQTIQRYPTSDKSVPARMARAVAYYKMPDIERAVAEMDSLIKESPKDPFFHELKGQILFENNRIKDALASYQEAVNLLPDAPLILTDLAKVELAQKDPELVLSAIAHLEKATALEDSNSDSWHFLSIAYNKAGNPGMGALALAEEALLNDDPKKALQQVELALTSLKENTPSRQRAQDVKVRAIDLNREKKEESRR